MTTNPERPNYLEATANFKPSPHETEIVKLLEMAEYALHLEAENKRLRESLEDKRQSLFVARDCEQRMRDGFIATAAELKDVAAERYKFRKLLCDLADDLAGWHSQVDHVCCADMKRREQKIDTLLKGTPPTEESKSRERHRLACESLGEGVGEGNV